jgi:SAM-dependent methyltransferase
MIEPKYGQIDPSTTEGRKAVGEGNRASWNVATRAHNSHKKDQAKFFGEGGNKLYPEEIALLGDVRGKKVLHLQCNAGQDTLSIANMGGIVTGVDISDEAIDFARKLSADSGVPGTFYRADVYDWLEEGANGDERWDVVFCSYGAIIWLADLDSWATGFAKLLKPGGRFVTVEFHPVEMMFETDYSHRYPYSTHGTPITWDDGISDYVAEFGAEDMPYEYAEGETEYRNPHPAHEFAWGVGEIVTALLNAGLTLESLTEYDYCNCPIYKEMKSLGKGRWTVKDGIPPFPMMYSISAVKAG